MAKPTKLRNRYYVRMAVTDTDGSTKYRWVGLGTDDLATAQERMLEVLTFSELIRYGKSIDFWWKTGNKNSINTLLLEEAIEKYIGLTPKDGLFVFKFQMTLYLECESF